MHLSPIALLMVQVAVVVTVGRLLGRLLRRWGQPAVIAEVVAGVVLGPSLLGVLWPGALAALFPPETMPGLSLISQLGLVFFMFLVGLEFDPGLLKGRGHQSVVISQTSIILPFLLGGALALPLHERYAPEGVEFTSFALFLGAAMSVTAFPVLARILAERGVLRTRIGAITLSCAAVDDVTAWCMLAFVVSFARAEGLGPALTTTALALLYIAVVVLFVRPLLQRLGPREGQGISAGTVVITLVLLLLSATATELIGIHALFGGFLLGAVMPRGGGLAHALTEKLEDFVTIVLLPLFFAYSGLRTQVGLLAEPSDWLACAAVIAVACAGKFGGSALAARFVGLSWREASAIGVLMNTRGLMELIVLNVGLDLGVLSPRLFTIMVIMALVTTWITSPLLEWIYPRRHMLQTLLSEEPAPAPARGPVILCASDPALVPALLTVGRALVTPPEPLVGLHVVRSDRPGSYLGGEPGALGPLDRMRERAEALGIPLRTLSFVAADPAQDICRVAEAKGASLVVLGTHRALLAEGELGGVVRRVLAAARVPVAILVDRGLGALDEMQVEGDDPAVLELASRLEAAGLRRGAGPTALILAPLGATLLEGRSALLVRGRAA